MVQTRDSCAVHRQEDIVDVLLSISRVSHRLASNLAAPKAADDKRRQNT